MIRGAILTVSVAVWSLPALSSHPVSRTSSPQQSTGNAKSTKAAPKTQMASLSGCVDEQNGEWVLVNEHTRAIITNLMAEGFPTEGFAKHLGHKVTVRGTANSAGSSPMFKVRSIEMLSETCSAR